MTAAGGVSNACGAPPGRSGREGRCVPHRPSSRERPLPTSAEVRGLIASQLRSQQTPDRWSAAKSQLATVTTLSGGGNPEEPWRIAMRARSVRTEPRLNRGRAGPLYHPRHQHDRRCDGRWTGRPSPAAGLFQRRQRLRDRGPGLRRRADLAGPACRPAAGSQRLLPPAVHPCGWSAGSCTPSPSTGPPPTATSAPPSTCRSRGGGLGMDLRSPTGTGSELGGGEVWATTQLSGPRTARLRASIHRRLDEIKEG